MRMYMPARIHAKHVHASKKEIFSFDRKCMYANKNKHFSFYAFPVICMYMHFCNSHFVLVQMLCMSQCDACLNVTIQVHVSKKILYVHVYIF